ncbi:hypothetical protein [Pararhodobacter sp.]|uniref:hypothetical protein n=1 Tax=Pararhodobacter sp. TaxID=2127056 RepID=UPI002FDE7ECF
MNMRSELRKRCWNTEPKSKFMIPSSSNPLINASRAIALSAYPNSKDHVRGGKAEKYSTALLANIIRISRNLGEVDSLPQWAKDMRVESMERNLSTGYRNLMRALTIRDVINSALTMKAQHNQHRLGEKMTFTIQYSPDTQSVNIKIPLKPTVSGYILSGRIPDTKLASLRAAILYHQPALQKFQGPAVNADGRDPEADYQNTYNRYVRPALFAQHIVQVVWDQITDAEQEATERGMPVDELLMRKPDWATNIHSTTGQGLGSAIYDMRQLGISSCWCEMVRFADPLPDS